MRQVRHMNDVWAVPRDDDVVQYETPEEEAAWLNPPWWQSCLSLIMAAIVIIGCLIGLLLSLPYLILLISHLEGRT